MGRQFALFYLTVLTLVMGAALAYGFIVGDFWEDGGELVDNPWGIVSLFGVGFFFFIGWIVYRESCPGDHIGLVGGDPLGRQRGQRVVCGHSPVAPARWVTQGLFLGRGKTQLFQGSGRSLVRFREVLDGSRTRR